ncbi:MAG: glycosyltransferase family 2 protein, partial [Patescibacteria group bacterium]
VLFLNNDTAVTVSAIPALVKALQQPHVGLVGARMLRMEEPTRIDIRGLALSSWGLAWNITNETDAPSLASGGCLLLSRRMIEQVSVNGALFDSKLFLYVEDVDLGLRALAHGWKSVTADEAVVYHVGSASANQHPDMALYYWHRNILWVMLKNFPAFTLWLNVVPVFLLHLAITLLYTLKGQGRIVWKAKWHALKGLPGVWQQRRQRTARLNQKVFKAILYSNWKAIQAWRKTSN